MLRTTTITIIACLIPCLATAAEARDTHWPTPIEKIAEQGVTVVKRFDAPAGLEGFAAKAGDRRLALYLLPDKQHVIVGTLLNAKAQNLTAPKLKAALGPSGVDNVWQRLAKASAIVDGEHDAPRIVYEFIDPNCPYCHRFYEKSRAWVESGKVQIRHLPVAVLKPSSLGKAAALLGADDPSAALARHEHNYESGGIEPLAPIPAGLKKQIARNTRLMAALQIRGTPGIVYRNNSGDVRIKQGLPSPELLKAILGPR